MGKRYLDVSTSCLLEFLKRRMDAPHYFTVENAIPDDARVIGMEATPYREGEVIRLVIESAEWRGDSREPLSPPALTIHFDAVFDAVPAEVTP